METQPAEPPNPIRRLQSKIECRNEFYSGDMRKCIAALTIEGISFYADGARTEESRKSAEKFATLCLLSQLFGEIRPLLKELLRELHDAPESKRRNRCIALVSKISESIDPSL